MYTSEISKLSDNVFDATCIHCGSTKNIQLWPHRNGHGMMVGFVFACSACQEIVKGIKLIIEGIRAPSQTEERRDSEQQAK